MKINSEVFLNLSYKKADLALPSLLFFATHYLSYFAAGIIELGATDLCMILYISFCPALSIANIVKYGVIRKLF